MPPSGGPRYVNFNNLTRLPPRIASLSALLKAELLVMGSTVTPSPSNPLGVKGVGEAGTIGAAPAIANAVIDALSPFGVRHLDMPFTPEKVWRALYDASTRPVVVSEVKKGGKK